MLAAGKYIIRHKPYIISRKRYIIARHGQTAWNAQNKVCGITDVELTDIGKEQAKALAYEVQGYGIDLILSSPLKKGTRYKQNCIRNM